jgi:tetratricopeptide (TPR) repeat protein
MSESGKEILFERVLSFFRIGQRRILLVPVVGIPAIFTAVKALLELTAREALLHPYFIVGSAALIALCIAAYLFSTRAPPPDEFRIVVAAFHPVSEKAEDEAKDIRDRIVEELRSRATGDAVCVHIRALEEVVDARSPDGQRRAEELIEEYRAHMVLGGSVRLDQEYYFYPFIVTRFSHPFKVPLGAARTATVPVAQSLELKRYKTHEEATIATFIRSLASIEAERYADAEQILAAIPNPGATVWFYRGFALLQLKRAELAHDCFVNACRLNDKFADAWLYAGFALLELGKRDLAHQSMANSTRRTGGILGAHATVREDAIRRMLHSFSETMEELDRTSKAIDKTLNETWEKFARQSEALELKIEANELLEGSEYVLAATKFARAIELYPEDADSWRGRALALANSGRAEDARATLQHAEGMKTREEARDAEGLQDEEGQLQDIELLLKTREESRRAYDAARVYAVLGDRQPMLANLEQALRRDPTNSLSARFAREFAPYSEEVEFKNLLQAYKPTLSEVEPS